MKSKLLLSLVLACFLLTPSFAQRTGKRTTKTSTLTTLPAARNVVAGNAQALPIKRVILYSNGVAYIERRGIISGNAEINLSFKQSQVDDVLKSMVVLDLGQGKIGAVSYNSSAPTAARTAEIPFSVDPQTGQATGIAGVLSQLQGAKVAVNAAQGVVSGSILTVEKRQVATEANKPSVTKTFLVIASETGEISSFDLDEVRSVKLLDEGTRRDVNEFANATASARRRDAKTITVTSAGGEQREMVVSYTIAAPIWKTTYRVVMDQEGRPFFQGWAIVDNVSDEDWSTIQLSLVSGTPISFIQPIQQPFYRYRPVIPMPEDLKLAPQVYEEDGTVSVTSGGEVVNTTDAKISTNITQQQVQKLPINGRATQNMMLQNSSSGNRSNTYTVDGVDSNETTVSNALSTGNSGVQTAATGEEIGDLFEYRIEQPVTVNRDRSALIPIIQTKMDGERVSIYNEAVRRDRPMGGMKLVNTSPLTLESGSLTVLDRDAYAGEALMERLKPQEQRFISYALDLGTLVTVRQASDNSPAKIVKVVNGTFQVHYFRQEKKTYILQNQTDKPRTVFIEYPVRSGWELSPETPKPFVTTQRYHRFRVELKGFDKQEITVSEQEALMDTYALTTLSRTDLQLFVSRRYIDDAVRARLEKLIELRVQIAQIESKTDAFDDEVEKIAEDQKRLRENIEALSKTPEAKTLIARYIAKADEQESRLEQMDKDRKTLATEKERLERELTSEVRNFELK